MSLIHSVYHVFFFNDTATTEIYTLSLHDALPISLTSTATEELTKFRAPTRRIRLSLRSPTREAGCETFNSSSVTIRGDRKSTRLNSSHMSISYAVFCLKKKKNTKNIKRKNKKGTR